MASKFPAKRDEKVELLTKKGHDVTWLCYKHVEPIKFFCKEHKIPMCDECATTDQCQKPCRLDDIEDVLLERRRYFDAKQDVVKEEQKQLKTIDSEIESLATFSTNHFLSVDDELKVAFKDKLKSVEDKQKRSICSINEEAEHAIRLINEKRETRIKACNEEAKQQQLIIKESQGKVESETNLKAIRQVVAKKIKDLKSENQHAINTMDNIDATIKQIKQDNTQLVKEVPPVIASLDAISSLEVHRVASECLFRMQREVQKVKFVEDDTSGKRYGRIDGYIGKWELVKSIHIPTSVNEPGICGWISDNEVCVRNHDDNDTYVTNISTGYTQSVLKGNRSSYFTSCASVDSNVIVCGKKSELGPCTGRNLERCITLYDRQWKVIRDISIPRKSKVAEVYVDVDRDGMILAAQRYQYHIYVINPADGAIVNTLLSAPGEMVLGEIRALSSGDIVVRTAHNEFTVITRSGEYRTSTTSDGWFDSSCSVDILTDTLYLAYRHPYCELEAVDQVSCDGITQARIASIVKYKRSQRWHSIMPCHVTHSGNLVAGNGDNFLVYKKRFIV